MKEIILLKDGEIALKGLNRSTFEDMLIKNIKGKGYKLVTVSDLIYLEDYSIDNNGVQQKN